MTLDHHGIIDGVGELVSARGWMHQVDGVDSVARDGVMEANTPWGRARGHAADDAVTVADATIKVEVTAVEQTEPVHGERSSLETDTAVLS